MDIKLSETVREADEGRHDSAGYRASAFVFSIACYAAFLGVFVYLLAFLCNLQTTALAAAWPEIQTLVPYAIDVGRDMGSVGAAVLIDVVLIALFGLQHSVMARPGFKRVWTRVVPKAVERSTYVLIASATLALLLWQWRPLPTPVLWQADGAVTTTIGWSVMAVGVAVLLWATFLIDHFELLGLRQGWNILRGRAAEGPPGFVAPSLYRFVRHPQYLGWLLIFWGTPTMSTGHFLFAAAMSAYILVAMRFEERDLVAHIGARYERYRRQVPPFVPLPGRRYRD
jgi:protein-S-isoprenylcysteine O-methyltransferase Ste14